MNPYSGLPEAVPYEGIEHYTYPAPAQQFNGPTHTTQAPYVQQQSVPNSPTPSGPPQYSELSAGRHQVPAAKSATAYAEEQPERPSTVPWWRRHLILLCIVAVVVIGTAVGGGVGGALVAEKKKSNNNVDAER